MVSVIRAVYQSSESGLNAVTLWLKWHCKDRVERQARSGLRFRREDGLLLFSLNCSDVYCTEAFYF